jgi:transcription antitermination factor NusG
MVLKCKKIVVAVKKTDVRKKGTKKVKVPKVPIDKTFLDPDFRFKNNTEQWMTVLLNDSCILLDSYKIIEKELEEVFGDEVIYFLPIYIEKANNKDVGFQLFDGYVFVKRTEIINEKIFIKKTDYLDKLLYKGSNPCFVTNRDINKFKTKLKLELIKRLPCKGSTIIANEGTFKNQEGTVMSVNKEQKTAIIEFHKRTRIVTAELSVISFDLVK